MNQIARRPGSQTVSDPVELLSGHFASPPALYAPASRVVNVANPPGLILGQLGNVSLYIGGGQMDKDVEGPHHIDAPVVMKGSSEPEVR